jgi:hypothetical protein
MIWTNLNLHFIRKLSWKYELFWLRDPWGKDFHMIPTLICISVIISPWNRTRPFFSTFWKSFHPRIICTKLDWTWPAIAGEVDFFFQYKHMLIWFSLLWPHLTSGDNDWNTLKSTHYIRKLSCKYKLFSFNDSSEEIFWKIPPYFCIFVIIFPLKRTWPLI